MIIYLSSYYEKNKDRLDNQWNIIKPIIVAFIIIGLVIIQPDMGTSVIIGLITLMMFYGVPISKKNRSIFNKIFLGGILVVVLVFITTGGKMLQSYQLDRLNFLIHVKDIKIKRDISYVMVLLLLRMVV